LERIHKIAATPQQRAAPMSLDRTPQQTAAAMEGSRHEPVYFSKYATEMAAKQQQSTPRAFN